MADNSTLPVSVGTEVFANKDVGGVKYPKHVIYDSAGAEVVPATHADMTSALTQQTAVNTVLGAKTDAAVTSTDATSVSSMSVWKQISASVQVLAGAVAATKLAVKAAAADFADGAFATFGLKADAANVATDTTAITAMSVFKQISKSAQALVTAFGAALTRGAGATDANTQRMALASDSPGIIAVGTAGSPSANVLTVQGVASGTPQSVSIKDISNGEWETVAASQTDQALGATGATGDYLAGLLVVPATTSPGAISIKDGAGSAITVFTGGATSVSNLVPFFIPLGIISLAGAWKITTGASVSVIGVGNFT
jgi:hypothetical protein